MQSIRFGMLLTLLSILAGPTTSSRILAVFPHLGKSHFIFFEPLLKVLVARGHELVVISPFPQKTPIAGYTDIDISPALPFAYVNSVPFADFGNEDIIPTIKLISALADFTCENVLSYEPIQNLIHSKQHFDLVLYETFNTDCFLGFVHVFKSPAIAMFSSPLLIWTNDRFGNPDNPSYIANLLITNSEKMTFYQRFRNSFYYVACKTLYKLFSDIPANKVARRYFGEDLPPLQDLAANTSLILINSHFSIHQARPYVPAIVEAAGLHIQPAPKLPQDIEKFLNEAEHGVIYFSFGSTLRAATMPQQILEAFVSAFSELPQRVLWKWENDTLPGQPKNVKTGKWLPQFSILSHPNVRVFMNHGGLMGSIEAIHNGIPMVSIPMLGDQYHNVEMSVEKGIAVKIPYLEISKETVLKALKEVLHNPKYRENAKRISRIYHDRPQSAMDTAVYWTEYVLRHGGAPHLRSAALDLNIFQYLLLDVFLVLVTALGAVSYLLYLVVKKTIRAVRGSSTTKINKKKIKSH